MRTKLMILVLMSVLTSCRNRTKHLEFSEYRSAEVTKIDTNTVVSTEKQMQESIKKEKKIDQQIREQDGNITIKGKTDSIKDFRFSNVVGNDTISDIYISGNADFVIKNRWRQVDKKEVITETKEVINFVAEIARKSVAQSTIKGVAEVINKKEVNVKSKGFGLPVYLVVGVVLIVLAMLFFLWKKFGGGIVDRFKNAKIKF